MSEARVTKRIDFPIDGVTLLEDRAVVTRKSVVALEPGRTTLELASVAPVLADKTVTVRAIGDATVRDVRVRRDARVTAEGLPEDIRRIDDELRDLDERVRRAEANVRAANGELAMLDETERLATIEVAEDASAGRLNRAAWEASFDRLASARADASRALVDLEVDLRELRAQVARKRERRAALATPTTRVAARLEIDVECAAASTSTLAVSYVVPGACWRPRHTATLLAGAEPVVRFEAEGVVWQNTGEDWRGVELVLSTERPSLGAEPPELETDLLTVTRKSTAVVVESREQKVEEAGLGGDGAPPPPNGLPGIDDGGEARRLVARGRHDVPSDGRPHAVTLFSFESPTRVELVSTPELAEAVYERTEIVNGADQPILAGPVDLVRSGGPYGKASVLYVAPREKFAIGWGPDASLRVRRTVEPLPEESTLLGGWTTRTEDIELRISNLGAEKRSIVVKERVPISEIEKVQIAVIEKETTDRKLPDENGFVTWSLELGPHARAKLKLRVATKRHADVVG